MLVYISLDLAVLWKLTVFLRSNLIGQDEYINPEVIEPKQNVKSLSGGHFQIVGKILREF